ncbi:MAG: rod shape-determining protein MreC, partial [Catalinimonas sp.]
AKVVNNSIRRAKNYFTLNRGRADGIRPGMGVASPDGVAGRVRAVSERYATVTSLLHTKLLIAAQLERGQAFGRLQWDGRNPRTAKLIDIVRHVKPQEGDTVVTSGYSALFPEGMPVGTIESVAIRDNDTYYDLRVRLFTDFSTLQHVYVIENLQRPEQDSLEVASTEPDEQ